MFTLTPGTLRLSRATRKKQVNCLAIYCAMDQGDPDPVAAEPTRIVSRRWSVCLSKCNWTSRKFAILSSIQEVTSS